MRILGRWTAPAAALALALLAGPAPAAHARTALTAPGNRMGEAARHNHVSPRHLAEVLGGR